MLACIFGRHLAAADARRVEMLAGDDAAETDHGRQLHVLAQGFVGDRDMSVDANVEMPFVLVQFNGQSLLDDTRIAAEAFEGRSQAGARQPGEPQGAEVCGAEVVGGLEPEIRVTGRFSRPDREPDGPLGGDPCTLVEQHARIDTGLSEQGLGVDAVALQLFP